MRRLRLAGIVVAALLATACLMDIHVLVWDRGEEKLVRVSVPMWLVRKAAEHGDAHLDFDDDSGEVARHLKPRLRWKDVEKAGLGVLAEVEEEDGDQVLVWLS